MRSVEGERSLVSCIWYLYLCLLALLNTWNSGFVVRATINGGAFSGLVPYTVNEVVSHRGGHRGNARIGESPLVDTKAGDARRDKSARKKKPVLDWWTRV